jgi:hypothetical protein
VRGERLRENKNMYISWVLVVGEENLGTLGLYVIASLGIEVWAEEAIATLPLDITVAKMPNTKFN